MGKKSSMPLGKRPKWAISSQIIRILMPFGSGPCLFVFRAGHKAGSAREHLLDIPAIANFPRLVGRPYKASVAPPVVAIPQQIAVVHKSINDPVAARERLLDIPAIANFPRLVGRPYKASVSPPIVPIPQQIAVVHESVNDPVAAREHLLDIPAVANFP